MITWVNGVPAKTIDLRDRGFQYGDGIFTTLPLREGAPLFVERHLARLLRDAERLHLPPLDLDRLRLDIRAITACETSGILKIQMTRGVGGRGYASPDPVEPTVVLQLHSEPRHIEARAMGVRVTLLRTPLGLNPRLAGIKHMNRLEQIIGRAEWRDEAIAEGLMLDLEGFLIEGTRTNVFLVKNGVVFTPLLDRSGIAGVMRSLMFEASDTLGFRVRESRLTLPDLMAADEVFLTNSVIGIWPVNAIDALTLAVGPFTMRMMAWLNAAIKSDQASFIG